MDERNRMDHGAGNPGQFRHLDDDYDPFYEDGFVEGDPANAQAAAEDPDEEYVTDENDQNEILTGREDGRQTDSDGNVLDLDDDDGVIERNNIVLTQKDIQELEGDQQPEEQPAAAGQKAEEKPEITEQERINTQIEAYAGLFSMADRAYQDYLRMRDEERPQAELDEQFHTFLDRFKALDGARPLTGISGRSYSPIQPLLEQTRTLAVNAGYTFQQKLWDEYPFGSDAVSDEMVSRWFTRTKRAFAHLKTDEHEPAREQILEQAVQSFQQGIELLKKQKQNTGVLSNQVEGALSEAFLAAKDALNAEELKPFADSLKSVPLNKKELRDLKKDISNIGKAERDRKIYFESFWKHCDHSFASPQFEAVRDAVRAIEALPEEGRYAYENKGLYTALVDAAASYSTAKQEEGVHWYTTGSDGNTTEAANRVSLIEEMSRWFAQAAENICDNNKLRVGSILNAEPSLAEYEAPQQVLAQDVVDDGPMLFAGYAPVDEDQFNASFEELKGLLRLSSGEHPYQAIPTGSAELTADQKKLQAELDDKLKDAREAVRRGPDGTDPMSMLNWCKEVSLLADNNWLELQHYTELDDSFLTMEEERRLWLANRWFSLYDQFPEQRSALLEYGGVSRLEHPEAIRNEDGASLETVLQNLDNFYQATTLNTGSTMSAGWFKADKSHPFTFVVNDQQLKKLNTAELQKQLTELQKDLSASDPFWLMTNSGTFRDLKTQLSTAMESLKAYGKKKNDGYKNDMMAEMEKLADIAQTYMRKKEHDFNASHKARDEQRGLAAGRIAAFASAYVVKEKTLTAAEQSLVFRAKNRDGIIADMGHAFGGELIAHSAKLTVDAAMTAMKYPQIPSCRDSLARAHSVMFRKLGNDYQSAVMNETFRAVTGANAGAVEPNAAAQQKIKAASKELESLHKHAERLLAEHNAANVNAPNHQPTNTLNKNNVKKGPQK